MCCSRIWLPLGAILAGVAVVAGVFAAHGVDRYFEVKYASMDSKFVAGAEVPASWKYLQDFQTAARFQMYHSLALIAVGILAVRRSSWILQFAGWSFAVGIVLFSGSLYIMTLMGPDWQRIPWGMVTPFGGTAFLLGWSGLATATIIGETD